MTLIDELDHAELSASGAERWLKCPGSVALSRGIKDTTSKWAREGTIAHRLFELWIDWLILNLKPFSVPKFDFIEERNKDGLKIKSKVFFPADMVQHVKKCVQYVEDNWDRDTEILESEQRLSLAPIHESMFGTGDISIYEPYGRIQSLDLKYGAGKVVEVYDEIDGIKTLNFQIAYYLLGLAYKYGWDFEDALGGIMQPRAKHSLGVMRYEVVTKKELRKYEDIFRRGVDRVFKKNPAIVEGAHCQWCKANGAGCPKKESKKINKLADMFEDL